MFSVTRFPLFRAQYIHVSLNILREQGYYSLLAGIAKLAKLSTYLLILAFSRQRTTVVSNLPCPIR